jgi:site-specific DNA-methyltransferase (adenine-specific)
MAAAVESFLNDRIVLLCGDCLDVLPTLADNSIDSVVCDPPYHLTSIVKRFGNSDPEKENYVNAAPKSGYMAGYMPRAGFMGKVWDGGDIAFRPDVWRECLRVLRPGGHLVAMGGTRTYHRLACAVEDAGFEIRDCVMWVYVSGFPKSLDVSKAIDKAAGYERGTTKDMRNGPNTNQRTKGDKFSGGYANEFEIDEGPAIDAARKWQGWGTALKPACELIVLARKPLSESTVAGNVLAHGTGALNIDGCRVGTDKMGGYERGGGKGSLLQPSTQRETGYRPKWDRDDRNFIAKEGIGRWPANLIHDGSGEVVGMFPESHVNQSYGDKDGSAARFFWSPKADGDDRLGSRHPTVKPVDLMQWLVRLVCPKGGMVLDPFAGTGTTGEAAFREGMSAVLIEREAEYQADIRRRMVLVQSGQGERRRESVKAQDLPRDEGPLFALR